MHGRISVKSYRCQRPFVPVTLQIRRYKKRGHIHELIMTVNTKGEKLERCKICKYHTKSTFSNYFLESITAVMCTIYPYYVSSKNINQQLFFCSLLKEFPKNILQIDFIIFFSSNIFYLFSTFHYLIFG